MTVICQSLFLIKMLGTPIWPDMWVRGPRLKNPSAIPDSETNDIETKHKQRDTLIHKQAHLQTAYRIHSNSSLNNDQQLAWNSSDCFESFSPLE